MPRFTWVQHSWIRTNGGEDLKLHSFCGVNSLFYNGIHHYLLSFTINAKITRCDHRGKEKKTKRHTKMRKNNVRIFYIKKELHQNLIEWPMNFSSGTEKKICFFFPLRGNTIFGYEWINHQRTFPCKKKYGNFETDFIIIDPKICAWK